VDLAPGHDGNDVVEQIGEAAQDPALRLAAQAQQDEVVLRENGVDQLRDDSVVEPDHAGKQRLAGAQALNQVRADLVLDRAVRPAASSIAFESAECCRVLRRGGHDRFYVRAHGDGRTKVRPYD